MSLRTPLHIRIETPVAASAERVWAGFDRALFEALAPVFPRVRVVRFDGCRPGDVVTLELDFGLFRNRWTSRIVAGGRDDGGYFFEDEGVELPFFLGTWRHVHRIEPRGAGCVIVDAIAYRARGGRLSDYVWWLPLHLQFRARRGVYRAQFAA